MEADAAGRVVARRAVPDLLARAVSELFAPAVVIAAMTVLVAWHALDWQPTGLAWGVAGALFTSAIPFGYILRAVHRGRITGHHIGQRHQRRGPLLFGLGCVLTGLVVLALLGAPRHLTALAVAVLAGGAVCTAVNTVWKMSLHTAVAAAAVAGLGVEFGWWLALATPLVALVGWSRVRLRDHTVAQVVAGAVVGAVVAGFSYAAAR